MKLLLDMYKSAPKEQRDKVQLMAAERKAKAEVRAPPSLGPASLLVFILTVWSKLIVVLCVDQCLRLPSHGCRWMSFGAASESWKKETEEKARRLRMRMPCGGSAKQKSKLNTCNANWVPPSR